MTRRRRALPFSAIVGQERLKLALTLNVVNPRIGGLLVQGPKGTGKSSAVHAMAALLPERSRVADCPFGCIPADEASLCGDCRRRLEAGEEMPLEDRRMRVVPLPLSISEDRLVGSVDVEKLLGHGERAFQPGVLAEANHEILYVDEVNLLPDHVADDLLDAAALGWNTVEREGFSITHPSSFVLVGTMNPEEGSLRPQLLDRFPVSVTLETIRDPALRVEIVRRNLFDGPEDARFAERDAEVERAVVAARERLADVAIDDGILHAIAKACVDLDVDGHRPEIVITRTAMTLAAYRGRPDVREEDVREASVLALTHRTREGGFQPPATEEEILGALDRSLGDRSAAPAASTDGDTAAKKA